MPTSAPALADEPWRRPVQQEIDGLVPANRAGGVAVALLTRGRTLFLSEGPADRDAGEGKGRAITPDSLFNIASLRKVFEAIVLAQAVAEGRMALDDPVTRYVSELAEGRDIRRVTLGELATHTSGLLLPQDHPPWPSERYTLASFLATLRAWQADPGLEPGRQRMYSHAGYILLQLAVERGLGQPMDALVRERILGPLGMTSSLIPVAGAWLPALRQRAVQGYAAGGAAVGVPGDQQTYYDWPGTGQMYSSARDLARFLAAHGLDAESAAAAPPALRAAMQAVQAPRVTMAPHHAQALAWEIDREGATLIEKNGGMNNASSYMALMPAGRLGLVVLTNRGDQDVASAGRRMLRAMAPS